jgi:hypothetical protein
MLSLCRIRIHTIVDGRSAANVGRANKKTHPRQSVAEKKSDTPKRAAESCLELLKLNPTNSLLFRVKVRVDGRIALPLLR